MGNLWPWAGPWHGIWAEHLVLPGARSGQGAWHAWAAQGRPDDVRAGGGAAQVPVAAASGLGTPDGHLMLETRPELQLVVDMAPRANWKGHLRIGAVSCAVKLFTAIGESDDEIHLNMVNRKTGHRLKRQFIDSETGEPVVREHQVKGYEVDNGQYIVLTPEEIEAAVPESTKVIELENFVPCVEVERLAIERPYYLAPSDAVAVEAFALIREAMRQADVAGIGRTVLFRRDRVLLLFPEGQGLLANLLHFDYEMRDESSAFSEIPKGKMDKEMLDLGKHIIKGKMGEFDPNAFEDRYDEALKELIRAKQRGEKIKPRPEPKRNVVDLREALRQSAGLDPDATPKKTATKKRTTKKSAPSASPASGRKRKTA
jgi:DNA end-binding protein Ku